MLRFIAYTQISKNDHNFFLLYLTFIGFLYGNIKGIDLKLYALVQHISIRLWFRHFLFPTKHHTLSYFIRSRSQTCTISHYCHADRISHLEIYILIKIAAFIYYHIAVNRNPVTKYIEYLNTFSSILSILFRLFVFSFHFFYLVIIKRDILDTPDNRPVHWNHCWRVYSYNNNK